MKSNYTFEEISACEMCSSPIKSHKVLGQRLNKCQGFFPKRKSGVSVSVMQCNECRLIYPNPLPIPENLQDHYGVSPESYWKEYYFSYDDNYFSNTIATIKPMLPFKPGMKALDIGAGLGKCMVALSKAGFDTYGLEPSVPFYNKAIELMKLEAGKLALGMVEEAEYNPETFDFVTFGAVFEHLYHPAACLERALKWVKKGGLVHIEVPSATYFIPKIINTYFRATGAPYVNNLSPMHAPYHLYEFTHDSFHKLGQRLGFTVEKEEHYAGDVAHGPKWVHPILIKFMELTRTGMQLTFYLRKI